MILRIIIILFWACSLSAIELSWDRSESKDVAEYRIYYGTESRVYDEVIDTRVIRITIPNNLFEREVLYYFAVTAVDYYGNESAFSNEVSWDFPLITDIEKSIDFSQFDKIEVFNILGQRLGELERIGWPNLSSGSYFLRCWKNGRIIMHHRVGKI